MLKTFRFCSTQQIGYFILSTAFLVVYLFTLISWVLQKRNVLSIYENGISYGKFRGTWDEIESGTIVEEDSSRRHLELVRNKKEKVMIPSSIKDFERIVSVVRARASFHANHPQ